MIDTSQMIYRLENSVNRLLQITKMTGIFSGSVGTSFFWHLEVNYEWHIFLQILEKIF